MRQSAGLGGLRRLVRWLGRLLGSATFAQPPRSGHEPKRGPGAGLAVEVATTADDSSPVPGVGTAITPANGCEVRGAFTEGKPALGRIVQHRAQFGAAGRPGAERRRRPSGWSGRAGQSGQARAVHGNSAGRRAPGQPLPRRPRNCGDRRPASTGSRRADASGRLRTSPSPNGCGSCGIAPDGRQSRDDPGRKDHGRTPAGGGTRGASGGAGTPAGPVAPDDGADQAKVLSQPDRGRPVGGALAAHDLCPGGPCR